MSQIKRNLNVDIIKVIAILCVLVIHCKFTDNEVIKYGFGYTLRTPVPVFLILASFVLSMSFDKNKIDSFKKAYDFKYILKRILRFIIPCFIIILIQVLFNYFKFGADLISRNNLFVFFQGGYGKGGYFNTIIIQFVFLFPLFYFLIKNKKEEGLFYSFLINLFYEFIKTSFLMTEECYRLIGLRYIFAISLGVYLYFSKKEIPFWKLLLSFTVGAGIIYLVDYTSYNPLIIIYWKDTSLFLCFYVFPIIWLFMRRVKFEKIKLKLVSLISKASYNIFLFQMLFYYIIDSLNIFIFENRIANIISCVIICLTGGVIFYLLEKIITSKIIKIVDKIDYNRINRFKKRLFHC